MDEQKQQLEVDILVWEKDFQSRNKRAATESDRFVKLLVYLLVNSLRHLDTDSDHES